MTWLHRLRNWRNPQNQTRVHLAALARRYGFEIGAHSYGRPKVRFPESGRKLTIGRYCSIADKVEILLGGDHRLIGSAPFHSPPFPSLAVGEGRRLSRLARRRDDRP